MAESNERDLAQGGRGPTKFAPGELRPIVVWGYRCERCEHEWAPRSGFVSGHDTAPLIEAPRVCPKCKSPYWNSVRRRTRVIDTKGGSQ